MNVKPVMILALACLAAAGARAQQVFTGSAEIVPEQVDRMYLKGLDFLARTQTPAGNWADASSGPAAICGLAVVSMLAHGDDPNFGPYSQTIHRGLDFLLKQQDQKTGYIGPSMYNHGFATLALAESYGAVNDARLGPALQKAVRLILTSQEANPAKAWRYSPRSPRRRHHGQRRANGGADGGPQRRGSGSRKEHPGRPEVLFLHADGGRGHRLYFRAGPNATRTAIGCVVMALAKDKDSTAFKSAFQFLKSAGNDMQYPAYFRYYASQAFFHGSPEAWNNWNHDNINTLRASQTAEGSWQREPRGDF